ncbi:MAG: VCBS repeat-containing protein, partial [Candidatus Paceibacterota bacterium]
MKKVIVFFLIIPFWNSLFAQTDFNNSTIVIPEFIDRSFNFSLFDKTSLVLASDVNGDEIIDLFVSGETPRHRMDVRSIELILGLDDSEEISFQSISWPIFSSSGTNSMSLFGSKALITTHRKDNSIYVHSFHTSEGASERLAIDLDSVDNALGVDFNNDRVKDILISSESEGKIRWLENNGEGEFNNTYLIGNTGTESKFFMGDINGDNYEDVITYNYDFDSGFEIIWFENKGDNKWGIAQSITDFRYKLLDFGMADLNNDGRQDIYYVANLFKIMWVPNEGDGKFGTPRLIHQVDVSEHNYRQLIHTDIDSDGDQDLIANLSPHILIFENDGSGSFNIQFDETFKSPENLGNRTEFYNTIALFDLELDGDEDILINRSSDGATLFLKNNGNAEFVEEEYPNLALGIYNSHTAGSFIHVADMDKDDDFDIVTYTEINSEPILAWYENLGEENFSEINIIDENIYIMGIHSADIDSDGDIDILVGMDEEGLVQYENQSGNFVKKDKSLVSNYYGYDFLALSDLEADSVIDIVFSWGLEFTYGGISWRQNDGSGYFGAERFVSDNAEGVKDIRAADIDNDGDQDIIASLITQNKLVYFLNNSNGEFGEMSQISEIEFGGYILIPSDLDNDGDIDILTASSTAETLSPEERENRTESDELMWFENLGDLSFKKNHIS